MHKLDTSNISWNTEMFKAILESLFLEILFMCQMDVDTCVDCIKYKNQKSWPTAPQNYAQNP